MAEDEVDDRTKQQQNPTVRSGLNNKGHCPMTMTMTHTKLETNEPRSHTTPHRYRYYRTQYPVTTVGR